MPETLASAATTSAPEPTDPAPELDPAEAPKPANPEPIHHAPADPEKGHLPEPDQGKSEHPRQ